MPESNKSQPVLEVSKLSSAVASRRSSSDSEEFLEEVAAKALTKNEIAYLPMKKTVYSNTTLEKNKNLRKNLIKQRMRNMSIELVRSESITEIPKAVAKRKEVV